MVELNKKRRNFLAEKNQGAKYTQECLFYEWNVHLEEQRKSMFFKE